ncbi:MAG: Hsp33 family molecular chaperone HslO [FCB group bacterium]
MTQEELKRKYLLSDRIISVISKDGLYRASAIKNSSSTLTGQMKHNLPKNAAFFLAQQLTAASLLASFLNGEERVIAEIESEGLIKQIYTEALQVGEVRGYMKYDDAIKTKNLDDAFGILGEGILRISRILYKKYEPIVGMVKLQNGDIAKSIKHYFEKSEQILTDILLELNFDEQGYINQSGGLILQALPGCSHNEFRKISGSLNQNNVFLKSIENHLPVTEILSHVLPFEFNIIKNTRVDYFCRCSKDNFMDKLIAFGIEEILKMQHDGHNELVCQYCNKKYTLTDIDFGKMIASLKAKNN